MDPDKKQPGLLSADKDMCAAILNALPEILFHLDKNGVFKNYHAPSPEYLLVPPEEFVGAKVDDVLPPALAETTMDAIRVAISTGEPQSYEYALRIRDEERFFEARVTRLSDDEALSVIREITKRRGVEEELRLANMQLSRALQDLKTAQNQIIESERMSALGQMASGISHDFNNALMPILGYSDFLLNNPGQLQPDNEETLQMLSDIRNAAKQAREAIRRLREFYRPADDTKRKAENLCTIVKDAVSLTRPKWKEEMEAKGVTIDIKLALGDVPVIIDANGGQIQEALANLIFNAVDAMPGGGTLSIAVIQKRKAAELKIGDTGIGMPEDVRRRCMEPFFTTKGEHGAGLGLAMVHGILQRHSGSARMLSTPGQGSTVTLTLPLSGESDAWSQGAVPKSAKPLRVLLMDDEKTARDVVARCISEDGHVVEWAGDGEDGLKLFKENTYDLIIVDRAMPKMSGDQVVTEIRKENAGIPIIMLTGFGDVMKHTDERPLGIDVLFSKPISSRELLHAIHKATQGKA